MNSLANNGFSDRMDAELSFTFVTGNRRKSPARRSTDIESELNQLLETKRLLHELQVYQIELESQKDEILASKAMLEAALASMSDAVSIYDMNGRLSDFNDAFATFHKFSTKKACADAFARNPKLLEVHSADGEMLPSKRWAFRRALHGEKCTSEEYILRRTDTGDTWVGSYSFSPILNEVGLVIGSVVTARDISDKKKMEMALLQSQKELRMLTAHQDKVKESERKRIAREIHDELGGLLTGIRANIAVSHKNMMKQGVRPDPLLTDAADLAKEAIEVARKVVTDLRPSVLDELGIWAALKWYAEKIETRSGLKCICVIDSDVAAIKVDPERSTMLFRIVQEALTNVIRHAEASFVYIQIAYAMDKVLRVTIQDDGKGIDVDRSTDHESWGIVGMKERARYFGGDLEISGGAGVGTTVVLKLPLLESNGK